MAVDKYLEYHKYAGGARIICKYRNNRQVMKIKMTGGDFWGCFLLSVVGFKEDKGCP